MTPLLHALGDTSTDVADAAEASFARIGAAGFDALIEGLAAERAAVRERCYRLLQGMGQAVRDQLLSALHSPDPRVTGPVARLLGKLGARDALAQALNYASPEHHEQIIDALLQEEMAAAEPLVNALLAAPEGREGVAIRALSALRTSVEIDHYLETRLRAAPDQRARQRLQLALRAPAEAFVGIALTGQVLDVPSSEPDEVPASEIVTTPNIPARPARRLLWGARRRD
ncbi:MAG: HEAT repeat domain-containing protein, partial [Anaerolineae bacterium]